MLLADIPQNLGESVEMIVLGILFVLGVLGTLAAIMAVAGIGFRKMDRKADEALRASKAAAATHAAETAAAAEPVSDGDLSADELAALIAAAVHTALGGVPSRIVAISAGSSTWAAEGRRQIFSSHQVR